MDKIAGLTTIITIKTTTSLVGRSIFIADFPGYKPITEIREDIITAVA